MLFYINKYYKKVFFKGILRFFYKKKLHMSKKNYTFAK